MIIRSHLINIRASILKTLGKIANQNTTQTKNKKNKKIHTID
jgi:hypothetical protein